MALYEPLPCPNCGAEKIDRHLDAHGNFFVQCSSCGLAGLHEDCGISAITTWNNLPRMSTIIAWQFQAAGLALALQRLEYRGQSLRNAQWLAGRYSCFATEAREVGREFDTALADARKVLEIR